MMTIVTCKTHGLRSVNRLSHRRTDRRLRLDRIIFMMVLRCHNAAELRRCLAATTEGISRRSAPSHQRSTTTLAGVVA